MASCSPDVPVLPELSLKLLLSEIFSVLLFKFTSFLFFVGTVELVDALVDDLFDSRLFEDETLSLFGDDSDIEEDDDDFELSFMVFFLKSTQFGGGFNLSPPEDGRSKDVTRFPVDLLK